MKINKTIVLLTCLALVMGFALIANAEVEWAGAGEDNLWNNSDNWLDGAMPGSEDTVAISTPPIMGPVIDSDIEIGSLRAPGWSGNLPQILTIESGDVIINGDFRFANNDTALGIVLITGGNITVNGTMRFSDKYETYGYVIMSGGKMTANEIKIGDDGGGEVHLCGDAELTVGAANFGPRNDSKLMLTISDDALLKIEGPLNFPLSEERAKVSSMKLLGGRIEAESYSNADVYAPVEVTNGVMVISGDITEKLENDIESRWITSPGDLVVEYDEDEDHTILKAVNIP